jgi:hypothetical protein
MTRRWYEDSGQCEEFNATICQRFLNPIIITRKAISLGGIEKMENVRKG